MLLVHPCPIPTLLQLRRDPPGAGPSPRSPLVQVCPQPSFVSPCRGKMEKEKERARLAGVIQAEPSAAEVAEDTQKERRLFQLHMCEVGAAPGGSGSAVLRVVKGSWSRFPSPPWKQSHVDTVQDAHLSPSTMFPYRVLARGPCCPFLGDVGPNVTIESPSRRLLVTAPTSPGSCSHAKPQPGIWGKKQSLLLNPPKRSTLTLLFALFAQAGRLTSVPRYRWQRWSTETQCHPPQHCPLPSGSTVQGAGEEAAPAPGSGLLLGLGLMSHCFE